MVLRKKDPWFGGLVREARGRTGDQKYRQQRSAQHASS